MIMSWRRFSIGAAGVLALAGTVALAGSSAPRTDRVVASFGLTMIEDPITRTCNGADGEYSELHDVFEGSLSSTDPRMTGILTVKADILVNTNSGLGTGHGSFSIRNATTGDLQITGKFNGVVVDFVKFKGLAWGNAAGGGGAGLVSNLSVVIIPPAPGMIRGSAIGNFGAPVTGVESDPGVIQQESCSGGYGNP